MDIYDLAERQHSVFHRDQALDLGYSASRLYRLGRHGRHRTLRPRGVAAPGCARDVAPAGDGGDAHDPRREASHRAAAQAAIHRWLRARRLSRSSSCAVDAATASAAGVTVHETLDLKAGDLDEVDGIPCTSLVRTLVDLPAVVHEFRAGVALDQCIRADPAILERVHTRHVEVATTRAATAPSPFGRCWPSAGTARWSTAGSSA